MKATTLCPCGKVHNTGAGMFACSCGRRYIVVKNGDVGFTSYSPSRDSIVDRVASGFVVKDGKLSRS